MSNMDKLEKDSEAYKASSYRDFFDASATDSFVAEDTVAYSQSLAKLEAVEAGIRYAAYESYNEGMAKGAYDEKIANVKTMLRCNVDIDIIKTVSGLTDEELSKLQ